MAGYHGGKRGQPSGGYQLYSWYFLRISGLALIFLALGHLFFTHYVKLPYETTFDFVAGRWDGPFWRTFDLLLLSMALVHGPMMGDRGQPRPQRPTVGVPTLRVTPDVDEDGLGDVVSGRRV